MPCMKDAHHNPLKRGNKESMNQQALTLRSSYGFFLKLTNYLTDTMQSSPQNDKPLTTVRYHLYVTWYLYQP